MNSANRVVIYRLDIALVLLLGLTGLGIWMGTECLIADVLAVWQPVEKQYQLDYDLPRLQAELGRDQGKLEKSQTKLIEQDIELARQKSALETLRKGYPQLPEYLGAADDAGIPGEVLRGYANALAMSEATKQRMSEWEPRLTAALHATDAISATLKGGAEVKTPDSDKPPQLRIAKAEDSSLEKKLVEERMALAEQTILVESMKKSYPMLHKMPDTASIPPAVVRAYIDVQVGIREAQRQVDQLTSSTTTAVQAVKQRSTALLKAERQVAQRLARETAVFGFIRSFLTLVVATAVTVLLLRWIFNLLQRHQPVATFNAQGVKWATAAFITVLFVYQAFHAASITLAGVALLTMLLWLIAATARQARARRTTGAATETA